uniref:SNF2 subfamily protein n=1 Tax=Marseillevirus LCMAC103 TaxID=2506604 RepID=A0A481YV05_9VIRU|nr:MAG: SNF2 subfamily protein [Marseillevirus LCMAC103]
MDQGSSFAEEILGSRTLKEFAESLERPEQLRRLLEENKDVVEDTKKKYRLVMGDKPRRRGQREEGILAVCLFLTLKEKFLPLQKKKAAITIQRAWRGWQGRKIARAVKSAWYAPGGPGALRAEARFNNSVSCLKAAGAPSNMEPYHLPSVDGDLLRLFALGRFDVIVHGCNCFHKMGAGIAKQIAAAHPEAVAVDRRTGHGDRGKLGTYSVAAVAGSLDHPPRDLYIVNAYTQYYYRGKCNTDYRAVQDVFRRIASDFRGLSVGIPKIGAGLGGGDWPTIEGIIAAETAGRVDVTVVQYKPN